MTTIRIRRRVGTGAVAAAAVLLASGCFFATVEQHQAASPETRPWFCNAVGDGTPLGGHGNGNHVNPIYEGMVKGPLAWEDCRELGHQLDNALSAVAPWSTRAQGEAAGWRQVAQYISGLGTHHAKGGSFVSTTFDPAKPQFLIYGGAGPEAPLVGVSYAAPGGANPPPAFAGTNDWWHLHLKICINTATGDILAGAEQVADDQCAAMGGYQRSLGPGLWLLHVWLVPRYEMKLDLFASGHPCLGATGPLPAEDPCWALAFRDPALGPPMDHGR